MLRQFKAKTALGFKPGLLQKPITNLELAPNVERATLYEHWRLTIEARPNHPYGDIVGYGFLRDENGKVLVDKQA